MRIAMVVAIVAAVGIAILSYLSASNLSDLSFKLDYGSFEPISSQEQLYLDGLGDLGFDEHERKFEIFEFRRAKIHNRVKWFFVPFFSICTILFITAILYFKSRGWRLVLFLVTVLVSAIMAIWSLLLSGSISIDEVFVAWIGACVLIVVSSAVAVLNQSKKTFDKSIVT